MEGSLLGEVIGRGEIFNNQEGSRHHSEEKLAILQMGKPRLKELTWIAQGHIARSKHGNDLNQFRGVRTAGWQ